MPRPAGAKDRGPRRKVSVASLGNLELPHPPLERGESSRMLRVRGQTRALEWFGEKLSSAERGQYLAWLHQHRGEIELE